MQHTQRNATYHQTALLARDTNEGVPYITARHCKTLQDTARYCNTLQHTATNYNTLQDTARHCKTLQDTATHCNTLRHSATNYNTLQDTATHCNTLQRTVWRPSSRGMLIMASHILLYFCDLMPVCCFASRARTCLYMYIYVTWVCICATLYNTRFDASLLLGKSCANLFILIYKIYVNMYMCTYTYVYLLCKSCAHLFMLIYKLYVNVHTYTYMYVYLLCKSCAHLFIYVHICAHMFTHMWRECAYVQHSTTHDLIPVCCFARRART